MADVDVAEGFVFIVGVGSVSTVEGRGRVRRKAFPFGFRAPGPSVKAKGPVARRKDVK